jgi:hypothetical protein
VFTKTLVDLFQLSSRKKLGLAQFETARLRVSGAVIHFASQVRMDYFDCWPPARSSRGSRRC